MHSTLDPATPSPAVSPRHAVLESLIAAATSLARAQLRELGMRLAGALVDGDTMQDDIRAVQLRLRAGNLLRDRQGLFVQLASGELERQLRHGLAQLAPRQGSRAEALALVPYEEMDQQVTLGAVARPFEAAHADALAALGARLAHLLDRGTLRPGQNPFRPDVFIASMQQAWAELHTEPEAADLLLPLLKSGMFYDLAPILEALNLALARHGVLPGAAATARARLGTHDATPKRRDPQLAAQLRGLFATPAGSAMCEELGDLDLSLPQLSNGGAVRAPTSPGAVAVPVAAERPLLAYLARVAPGAASNVIHLPSLKAQAPQGSLSRADESTIDLLAAVFDTVYGDQAIAGEIRDLIRLLQLPVLKTALLDKGFFFDDDHPARRLLDLLSHLGWEQSQKARQDPDDPLVRAMRRSVEGIGESDAQQPATFAKAVTELEATLREEEAATAAALAGPVADALRQEQRATAARAAREAVAQRLAVGEGGEGGEVAAVVAAFLQQQWTDVLTLAHGIEEGKPGAVANAVAAMDELLWSVRPKSGADERRQLIKRLPGLLAALNRWLDVVGWQDAGRLRFFADLAECHASIVRAPLDLAPARQLALSVEATRHAAERAAQPVPPDDAVRAVDALVRGAWLEFATAGAPRRVKLAWISPLRSLYIFSNGAREEAFSLSADELAQRFRAGAAAVLPTGDLVARALTQAIGSLAVNDADADASAAARAASRAA